MAAFSIDDETTTEIDDCLSLQQVANGLYRIGVHIAAPALAVRSEDPIDKAARERMTTVYSPGSKITMLPEPVVRAFSLDAGSVRPALSLYVDVDPQTMQVMEQFSRIDRIRVAANLRHNQFDGFDDDERFAGAREGDFPHAAELAVLWRFTLAQSAERDRMRGKPEQRSRADFSFYVHGEEVEIRRRRRDAPVDRIVAEMAILANSLWGKLLADHGVSGLYRSQAVGRVKMSTHALEHQGLGVAQYAWCTSPLRRYVDLVNQMQLVAVLNGEDPAFEQNDTRLFAILAAFEGRVCKRQRVPADDGAVLVPALGGAAAAQAARSDRYPRRHGSADGCAALLPGVGRAAAGGGPAAAGRRAGMGRTGPDHPGARGPAADRSEQSGFGRIGSDGRHGERAGGSRTARGRVGSRSPMACGHIGVVQPMGTESSGP